MKKVSRTTLSLAITALLIGVLVYAFWPTPTLVDIGKVSQAYMQLSIEEEGYTRVGELYQVSAPINGRMLRIALKPGDKVQQNETVLARMLPNLLSVKESQQAKANVQVALATVDAARATLKRVESEYELAKHRAQRAEKQVTVGAISVDENEQLQQDLKSSEAEVVATKSMLEVHLSELTSAKAALIGNENGASDNNSTQNAIEIVDIVAPITGRVLSISEKNESVLIAGAPIMALGDIKNDLEIVVEMLSSDAVQVAVGQKVVLKNWLIDQDGYGVVTRIEPLGFIKTSALGVEERRVNVIVKPNNEPVAPNNIGHGFRVDAAIVLWENEKALQLPTSALFRENDEWAVFVIEDGATRMKTVQLEYNNGIQANVVSGLSLDEELVLYPSAELTEGERVTGR